MQKILVIGQLPPPVHGSNVMTQRFMDALAENGVSAFIVEKAFSKQLAEVGKKDPKKLLKVPGLYQRVKQAIAEHQPNICIYYASVELRSFLVDCLILALLRSRRVPYVLYFHGLGYQRYKSANRLVRAIVDKALSGALGGMVLGDRLKADVRDWIPEDRLYILPNSIPDLEKSQADDCPADKAHVQITFLSNLIPSKGPMVFLRLAEHIRKQVDHVCFTLAGRHPSEDYLAELKAFISQAGLEDCVIMPGPVYGVDKEKLLRDTDLLVFPTSYPKETFGLVNIEAMQWGLPVVSSSVGAIPEIVQDGVNGYIVDPEDMSLLTERVMTLVRDKELRREMGATGKRLFAEKYSPAAYRAKLKSALLFFERLECEGR